MMKLFFILEKLLIHIYYINLKVFLLVIGEELVLILISHYSYHKHFNIEIQDIPIGKYNLEYVCQKYRYKTKFNVSIE